MLLGRKDEYTLEWTEVKTKFISTTGVWANWFERAVWTFVTRLGNGRAQTQKPHLIRSCTFPATHFPRSGRHVTKTKGRAKGFPEACLAFSKHLLFLVFLVPLGDTCRCPLIHNPKAHLVSAPLASIHWDNLLPAAADTRHFTLHFSRFGFAFVLYLQPAHAHTTAPGRWPLQIGSYLRNKASHGCPVRRYYRELRGPSCVANIIIHYQEKVKMHTVLMIEAKVSPWNCIGFVCSNLFPNNVIEPTAPPAPLKTTVLLLDSCHFYVSDQSAVKGCRKGPVGVARGCKGPAGVGGQRGAGARGAHTLNAACSFNCLCGLLICVLTHAFPLGFKCQSNLLHQNECWQLLWEITDFEMELIEETSMLCYLSNQELA